jgi:hypothetical protein
VDDNSGNSDQDQSQRQGTREYLSNVSSIFRKHLLKIILVPSIIFVGAVFAIYNKPAKTDFRVSYLVDSITGTQIVSLFNTMKQEELYSWLLQQIFPDSSKEEIQRQRVQHRLEYFLKFETSPPFDSKELEKTYQSIEFTIDGVSKKATDLLVEQFDDHFMKVATYRSFFYSNLRQLKSTTQSFSIDEVYAERNSGKIFHEQLLKVDEIYKQSKSAKTETPGEVMAVFDAGKLPDGQDQVKRARAIIQMILVLPLEKQREILRSMVAESNYFIEYSRGMSDKWVFVRTNLLALAEFKNRKQALDHLPKLFSEVNDTVFKSEIDLISRLVRNNLREMEEEFRVISTEAKPSQRYLLVKVALVALLLLIMTFLGIHFAATVNEK